MDELHKKLSQAVCCPLGCCYPDDCHAGEWGPEAAATEAVLAIMAHYHKWEPIDTAPKDCYFLAYAMPNGAESKLLMALDFAPPGGEIIVAHKRNGDPKVKVRTIPGGQLRTATHWMRLPRPPAAIRALKETPDAK